MFSFQSLGLIIIRGIILIITPRIENVIPPTQEGGLTKNLVCTINRCGHYAVVGRFETELIPIEKTASLQQPLYLTAVASISLAGISNLLMSKVKVGSEVA